MKKHTASTLLSSHHEAERIICDPYPTNERTQKSGLLGVRSSGGGVCSKARSSFLMLKLVPMLASCASLKHYNLLPLYTGVTPAKQTVHAYVRSPPSSCLIGFFVDFRFPARATTPLSSPALVVQCASFLYAFLFSSIPSACLRSSMCVCSIYVPVFKYTFCLCA